MDQSQLPLVVGLAIVVVAFVVAFAIATGRGRQRLDDQLRDLADRDPAFTYDEVTWKPHPSALQEYTTKMAVTEVDDIRVEVTLEPTGWRTSRTAPVKDVVYRVRHLPGLPAGFHAAPKLGASDEFTVKASDRGAAEEWFEGVRRATAAAWRERTGGYLSISENLGLAVHRPGTVIDDAQVRADVAEVVGYVKTLG